MVKEIRFIKYRIHRFDFAADGWIYVLEHHAPISSLHASQGCHLAPHHSEPAEVAVLFNPNTELVFKTLPDISRERSNSYDYPTSPCSALHGVLYSRSL